MADDVFTNAIKTARGSDNTEEDRTALQKAIDVASDPQSGALQPALPLRGDRAACRPSHQGGAKR